MSDRVWVKNLANGRITDVPRRALHHYASSGWQELSAAEGAAHEAALAAERAAERQARADSLRSQRPAAEQPAPRKTKARKAPTTPSSGGTSTENTAQEGDS